MSIAEIPRRLSRILLVALLVLAAPAGAQVEASHELAPVGYWSLATPGYDASNGRPLEVVVIVRFDAAGTFEAVLKTHDGTGQLGSSAPFAGRWELRTTFGREVVCIVRRDLAGVVCDYTVDGGGLLYGNRPLRRHTADEVRAIAPELVGP